MNCIHDHRVVTSIEVKVASGATLLVFHELYTTEQTVVGRIVMILLVFDGTYGGHVPCGVTAHGSPGGPLQFDRRNRRTPQRRQFADQWNGT